jgi:hypothetical protein
VGDVIAPFPGDDGRSGDERSVVYGVRAKPGQATQFRQGRPEFRSQSRFCGVVEVEISSDERGGIVVEESGVYRGMGVAAMNGVWCTASWRLK